MEKHVESNHVGKDGELGRLSRSIYDAKPPGFPKNAPALFFFLKKHPEVLGDDRKVNNFENHD